MFILWEKTKELLQKLYKLICHVLQLMNIAVTIYEAESCSDRVAIKGLLADRKRAGQRNVLLSDGQQSHNIIALYSTYNKHNIRKFVPTARVIFQLGPFWIISNSELPNFHQSTTGMKLAIIIP